MEFLKDKEYLGTVQDMHLNGDYCAVRFDGKILLHVLEGKDIIKIRLTHMFHPNIQILGHLTANIFEADQCQPHENFWTAPQSSQVVNWVKPKPRLAGNEIHFGETRFGFV